MYIIIIQQLLNFVIGFNITTSSGTNNKCGNDVILTYFCCWFVDADAAVQAEPQQNGYRNTSSELHCSTTASSDVSVTITWFRGQGENRTQLEGVPIFNITELVHAGIYTCQVYFSQKDIRIEKLINFTVIGKIIHSIL